MKLSKQEFLSLSGMGHDTLNTWIEEEWLVPSGTSLELSFTEVDIARARLVWRERRGSGGDLKSGRSNIRHAKGVDGIASYSSEHI